MQTRKRHQFIELCMAMLVTTLVMGALAAFTMAMASAWRNAEQTRALTLRGNHAVMRLHDIVQQSRLIGAVRAGQLDNPMSGAAVMLWKEDTNGDGLIQGAEVQMVIHDIATSSLRLYGAGQGDAVTAWSYSTVFISSTVFADFMVGRTSTPLLHDVTGAMFESSATTSTSLNPSLSYSLKIVTDPSSTDKSNLMLQYGAATIRAPLPVPGN